MPDLPAPLLFALLAFQKRYLSREQLLEATSMWMGAPTMNLGQLLVDGKFLTEAERAEVESLVDDWVASRGSESRRSTMTPGLRDTIVEMRRAKAETVGEVVPAGEKYELGVELGRGGIGRVVEAEDRELGRKVALKLMLEDSPGEILERFRWEARITGRLDHPNIVPVHEIGTLAGTKEVFLCMKRIVGRDLGWAIAEGTWPLRKLVEAVRDACRAIAYAHSLGVIHRDLKPANIMVGDFGEVLVVDWGLARLIGEEDRPSQLRRASSAAARPGRIAKQEETSNLTLEGDILGTPSYMPPEQAMGWLSAIDERSDVYAMGATLYEVLTAGIPPFDGGTAQEVVARVVKGGVEKPSMHHPCPPELEAICLRALSYQSNERQPSVKALQNDLDAWLEGATEHERRERLAAERLASGKEALERWRRLAGEAQEARVRFEQQRRDAPMHASMESYCELYRVEDRARQLEVESVEALADADDALDGALSLVPEHAEARRLKAEVHWELFVDAERKEDWRGEILARRRVVAFNDGGFDELLRGDGTLEVRTRAYPCRCLLDGREVQPAELDVFGYHPWSGRRWDGVETEFLPDLELAAPLRLRVHAASCNPSPLTGAEVWAWKYEAIDRILIPVTPPGTPTGPEVPGAVMEELFANSPYRPRGVGQYLGRTPLAPRAWPRGQWLLVVVASGKVPQRFPIGVKRGEPTVVDLTLFERGEIPPGHLLIGGGAFDRVQEAGSVEVARDVVEVDETFLAKFPMTCAEYGAALNALDAEDPMAARERAPRMGEGSGWYWPRTGHGWVVPTAAWVATASDGERARAAKLDGCSVDWEETWPVLGLSWADTQKYALRKSRQEGWLFTTPPAVLRELASRGFGLRRYPWGDLSMGPLANSNQSRANDPSPAPVGSFAGDESPWGIRDAAGNASDRCLTDAGSGFRRWRCIRGGSWQRTHAVGRTTFHQGGGIHVPSAACTLRTAAVVRLSRRTS